jgi:ParB family chromosome partitioning protein
MSKRGGLGRGLGSLIPTSATTARPSGISSTAAPDEAVSPTSILLPASPATEVDDARIPGAATPSPSDSSLDEAGSPDLSIEPDVPDGGLVPVAGATFAELDITAIRPNPKQPRQVFDEDALAELAMSVREFGVLQPVVVRPISPEEIDASGDPTVRFELVMGERRLRAASAGGLTAIPAIIRETADDALLRDALLENLHRSQLNPLEEAAAYQQLLEEFGTTHDELAHRIGRSRSQVSNTIRLLNLPVVVQRRVAAGVLSAGHARALLALDSPAAQDELAARIVAEGLSVRATEELVALAARGGTPEKPAARRVGQRITAPAIADLSEKLSDAFDTRVRVELGRRKGKITVEFGSIDDLERLVAMMAPQLATSRAPRNAPSP